MKVFSRFEDDVRRSLDRRMRYQTTRHHIPENSACIVTTVRNSSVEYQVSEVSEVEDSTKKYKLLMCLSPLHTGE
jgi:hypothetical protein